MSKNFRAAILVSLFALSACGRLSCLKALDFPKENAIQSAYEHDLDSLDPAAAKSDAARDILPALYETLYQYSYLDKNPKLVPLLAAEFPVISKDRLTIRIPLRKGVLFHDSPLFKDRQNRGREMTAKDVVFSLKRLAHPGLSSTAWGFLEERIVGMNIFADQLIKSSESDRLGLLDYPVEGLSAPDPFTVKIHLKKPFPQLVHFLTMPETAIVPVELVKAHSDAQGRLQDYAVGTGPFTLLKWIKTEQIVLDRNMTYHDSSFPGPSGVDALQAETINDISKPLPLVDQLRFRILNDEDTVWRQFVGGELGFVRVSVDRYGELIRTMREKTLDLEKQGFQMISQLQPSVYFLAVNMKDPLLGSNKPLRQALSSALQRKDLVDDLLNGVGDVAGSILPRALDLPWSERSLKYGYDPMRAQALIHSTGLGEEKGSLAIKIDVADTDSLSRKLSEKLKSDLEKAGFKVILMYQSFDALLKKMQSGDYQIAFTGWDADYLDPQSIFQLFYGPSKSPGLNVTFFENKKYDQIYQKFSVLESSYQRRKMVEKLDAILQEELPVIPIFSSRDIVFVGPKLKNIYDSLKNSYRYKYIRVLGH